MGYGTLHVGDSEFIILDVIYDSSDNRWKLMQAFYSAHWNTINDRSTSAAWGDLEYRQNPQGYPVAWVALDKHGNYPTEAVCDGVPYWPFHDNCGDPVEGNGVRERFPVDANRNLGGRPPHDLKNCTQSINYPNWPYTGTECFWTSTTFKGWHDPSISGGATGYKTILDTYFP